MINYTLCKTYDELYLTADLKVGQLINKIVLNRFSSITLHALETITDNDMIQLSLLNNCVSDDASLLWMAGVEEMFGCYSGKF